jgi:uncharacterized protein YpmS
MKKILLLLITILFTVFSVNASDTDTSIIDKLDESKIEELNVDFKLKTFKSCENLESVMGKYIKDYYKNNKLRYNHPIIMYKTMDDGMLDTESLSEISDAPVKTKSISSTNSA